MRLWVILTAVIALGCEGQIVTPVAAPAPVEDALPCLAAEAPAPSLRRLTRTEYANIIRDLVEVAPPRGDELPEDSKQGVLTVNGSAVLGLADLQAYAAAAESVAGRANLTRLLPCDPNRVGAAPCGEQFVDHFVRRAYRRPLLPDESLRLRAFFEAQRARSGFDSAVRLTLELVLQSPHFLFHIERSGEGQASPVELASRLSFFLWASTPDTELLDAAEHGQLTSSGQLSEQLHRMLADPRSAAATGSFHANLLGLDRDAVPAKNAAVHPNFNRAVWEDMVDETTSFADYVVRMGDGRFSTLLTASYSFPRGGPPNQPVPMDATKHAGILTHASVMTALSNTDTTSPARRGAIFLRNVMCKSLNDPPDDAPTMLGADPISRGLLQSGLGLIGASWHG